MNDQPTLRDLQRCFDGRVPAVIATSSATGVPNITYLSAVHPVDDQRVALSNQFMSKTARNLAEQPCASLLLIDPVSYSEFRLAIRYERTDRRGPVFERLRDDVDKVAAMSGMREVFRLRSADICRVESIEVVVDLEPLPDGVSRRRGMLLAAAAELVGRMSRCGDVDTAMDVALAGLDELLGHRHSAVMLLDEVGTRLFTIASHGFTSEGVGSELEVGSGVAGTAAERCQPVRVAQLRQMQKYAQSVRRSFERDGVVIADVSLPTLSDAQSCLAVPAMSRGELVGVLLVESPLPAAFDADDEAALVMVAALLAQAIDAERSQPDAVDRIPSSPSAPPAPMATASSDETHLRFFREDGSVFLDGEYLIRGVAGRILWSVVQRHVETGQVEFTNKELRLDRSLELPGFRDNLDTRLVMLKRRLEERRAPLRMERTGRGRFRLQITTPLRLEAHD